MSPILLRPVREQLEHDRVIRLLQARWKRRYLVGINPGAESNAGVQMSTGVTYPDLVLTSPGGRKPAAVVEVETAESVNRMEALFEWARMASERAAFHLVVPTASVEVAKRLCQDNHIGVTEIWTFDHLGDHTRFSQVYRAAAPAGPKKSAPARPHPKKPAGRSSVSGSGRSRKAAPKKPTSRKTTKAPPVKRRAAAKRSASKAGRTRSGHK